MCRCSIATSEWYASDETLTVVTQKHAFRITCLKLFFPRGHEGACR